MKALAVVAILAVVCIVLFVTGVISPRASRRMERKVDGIGRKGQSKGEAKAGKPGDATAKMLKGARHAAATSADKGRRLHDRLND